MADGANPLLDAFNAAGSTAATPAVSTSASGNPLLAAFNSVPEPTKPFGVGPGGAGTPPGAFTVPVAPKPSMADAALNATRAFGTGLGGNLEKAAGGTAMIFGMPVAALIDAVTGGHAAADYLGSHVQQTQDIGADTTASAEARNKLAAQTGELVGTLAQYFLPTGKGEAVATGASRVLPWLVEHAPAALAKAAVPTVGQSGALTADALQKGASTGQAEALGLGSLFGGLAANAAPISVPGKLLTRAASGLGIQTALTAGQQAAEHAIAPSIVPQVGLPDFTDPNTYMGAALAALFGPRARGVRMPDAKPEPAADTSTIDPGTPPPAAQSTGDTKLDATANALRDIGAKNGVDVDAEAARLRAGAPDTATTQPTAQDAAIDTLMGANHPETPEGSTGTANDHPVAQIRDTERGPVAEPAPEASQPEPAPEDHATADNPVREVPLRDITGLDADVPQFKKGASETGEVEPLQGDFDRRGLGPIQLWQRNDGSMTVISGRHRYQHAIRTGQETIPAQVYREANGFTKDMAASLDAELNIRDGQGSVADYVQHFQRPAFQGTDGRAEAESRGLLARATGRRAYTIARQGDPELVAAHRAGQVTDEQAVQIAQAAPNDQALQTLGMQRLQQGDTLTKAVNVMRAAKSIRGDRPAQQGDIFGLNDSGMRDASAMADAAAKRQREIGQRLAAISGAAKRPEVARAEGIDVHKPDAVRQRITELRAERDSWENWETDPAKVAQLRSEAGLESAGEPAAQKSIQAAPQRDDAAGGLFPPPTSGERNRAAAEAKDTARNGRVGGREDTGDGGLFDGPRPEQVRIPDRQQGKSVDEVREQDLSPEDQELVRQVRGRSRRAQEDRELSDAMQRESAARGEQDARNLGLRTVVGAGLGADRTGSIHYIHDEDGLPAAVRARGTPIKQGNVRYGLHTSNGEIYIFTKSANTPARALWTAWHENGHEAIQRIVAAHPDVRVGSMTAREAHQRAREMFMQNPTVKALAEVIARQRKVRDLPRMAEEAMAELHAARETDDWSEIKRKYGIDVPPSMRGGVGRAIDNFVRRIKAIMNAVYARISGDNSKPFSDADVVDFLTAMHEAGRGDRAGARERVGDVEDQQVFHGTPHRGVESIDVMKPALDAPQSGIERAPGRDRNAPQAGFSANVTRTLENFKREDEGHSAPDRAGVDSLESSEEPQRADNEHRRTLAPVRPDAEQARATNDRAAEPPNPADAPPLGTPRAPGESLKSYGARIIREGRETMLQGVMRDHGMRLLDAEGRATKLEGRGVLRAYMAGIQRNQNAAEQQFKAAMKVFDGFSRRENLDAIHQWETGQEVTSAPHRLFFAVMDKAFKQRIDAIRKIDPTALQSLIQNYFPHLWKDPTRATKWYASQLARRPLQGDRAFLKQRVYATIREGMASGLEPISANPVDLFLGKLTQMDKFIAFGKLRGELDGMGWLHKLKNDERVPYGYARVDNGAFNGVVVPETLAKDINNYLSPGFNGNKAFRALRWTQNTLTMAQLGWSGFHAGFTTFDNAVLHAEVGLRRALMGDFHGAVHDWLHAPLSIVASPIEGGALNRSWVDVASGAVDGKFDAMAKFFGVDRHDVNTLAILDALEQGGARWKMSRSDYTNDLNQFLRAFRQKDVKGSLQHALGAFGEAGSFYIHHVLVPNQKMAARVLLAKYELDRLAGVFNKHGNADVSAGNYKAIIDAMDPTALRQVMGKVVHDVDSRLGQMAYDNLFWNRSIIQIGQTAFRALGWQIGTVGTVTGGVRDLRRLWSPEKLLAPLDKGGKITDADMGRVTGRTSYLLTLAIVSGMSNALLQYALTGQAPSELKDYFFPRTGRKNADGSDERLQLPSYWMDHWKIASHPLQTLGHKINPLFELLAEPMRNQNFWGAQIRDPHAKWDEQAAQLGKYWAAQFLPFTFSNGQKVAENGGKMGRQIANFFGVTNAPASVTRSDFQAFVGHNGNKGFGHEMRSQVDLEHSRAVHQAEAAIRQGDTPDMTGMTPRDRKRIAREVRSEVPELEFRKMDIEDKLQGWDMATPKERVDYNLRRNILLTAQNAIHTDRFMRLPEDQRQAIYAKLREIRNQPTAGQ